jgi:sulfur carrier protein ThiS
MILANDINEEMVGGSQATLVDLLNKRAAKDLGDNPFIKTVDGEIVPTSQFEYGVHYNLGDIIEVQGNSEIVQACRVTEYIRSQDEAGEKAYPTVTMLD